MSDNQATQADPRVYLAAERTVLAWIRTGLALMGFGFVLARFGIFLRSLTLGGILNKASSSTFSVSMGTALIAVGVAVELLSLVSYRRLIRDLNNGIESFRQPSWLATCVSILMAIVGCTMAIYLLFFR